MAQEDNMIPSFYQQEDEWPDSLSAGINSPTKSSVSNRGRGNYA